MKKFFLAASLLVAAPLFSLERSPFDPRVENDQFEWFQMTESRQEVARLLGPPILTGDAGPQYTGWQYRIGEIGDEDFSHYLTFSKASGTLVSIVRNFDPQKNVDAFFPEAQT